MLKCRVVMGDPYIAQKPHTGRRPPLNPRKPGLPYDSVFAEEDVTVHGMQSNGGKQFHNEYNKTCTCTWPSTSGRSTQSTLSGTRSE